MPHLLAIDQGTTSTRAIVFDDSHLPDGHGLQLLKSRLSMTFGETGTLTTESRPGRTRVTLTLPFTETTPVTLAPARLTARVPASLT